MAEYYVRSTTGSDTNSGLGNWSNAFATLGAAIAVAVAGDTIFLSQVHVETYSTTTTVTPNGAYENPVKIICVNDGAAPPTTLATTALLETASGVSLNFRGNVYVYGVRFEANALGSTGNGQIAVCGQSVAQRFEECLFFQRSTSTSPNLLTVGFSNGSYTGTAQFLNCHFKNGRSNYQWITVTAGANAEIIGGTYTSVSAAYTAETFSGLGSSGEGFKLKVVGLDMSSLDPSMDIFGSAASTNCIVDIVFNGVKVPSGWNGAFLLGSVTNPGVRARFHAVDGSAGQRTHVFDTFGTIDSDGGVYLTANRAGFASNSHRITSDSRVNPLVSPLVGEEFHAIITPSMVAVPQTATIEVVLDSAAAITDDEVWMDVSYPASATSPIAGWVSDRKSSFFSSPTTQTISTAEWTGIAGFANPQKRKLQVTFTPQSVGILVARVVLARPSTTIYVDPDVRIAAT